VRPLANLKVLDFGQFVAGPLCGLLLAEFGADVIRIERPEGAPDRDVQPLGDGEPGGAIYRHLNRGKRSLAMDPFHGATRPLLDALLARSDVVIANVPPQTRTAMGLDFERIRAINPGIILAANSAFGETGPLAAQPGYDGVGQAMSGAMHLTGEAGQPRTAYVHYVDYLSAALGAYGIMMALRMRESTGRGQVVHTSLLGSALLTMAATLMEERALGLDREGSGNRAQSAGPADVYAARDGHVLLQVVGPGMFRRCARLLGREDWLSDERFQDDDARGRHGAELSAVVASWCAPRSVQECLAAFAAAGLPAAPVLSPRQVLEHTGITAGGFWLPGAGLPLTRIPLALSDCAAADPPLPPAPALGADTRAILDSLALDPAALAALRAAGALGIPGGE